MKMSSKGINLLKEFEGLRLKAYQDVPGGTWTIGYGSTRYEDGSKVGGRDVISPIRAEKLLSLTLKKYEEEVSELFKDVNQNQFDALVSFNYNLGKSNLLNIAKLYESKTLTKEEWCAYNKARINGKLTKLPGLVKRREKEWKLFTTPVKKETIKKHMTNLQNYTQETTNSFDDRKTELASIQLNNFKGKINISSTKLFMIVLSIIVAYAFITGKLSENNFMLVAMAIIGFYTGAKINSNLK